MAFFISKLRIASIYTKQKTPESYVGLSRQKHVVHWDGTVAHRLDKQFPVLFSSFFNLWYCFPDSVLGLNGAEKEEQSLKPVCSWQSLCSPSPSHTKKKKKKLEESPVTFTACLPPCLWGHCFFPSGVLQDKAHWMYLDKSQLHIFPWKPHADSLSWDSDYYVKSVNFVFSSEVVESLAFTVVSLS